MSASPPTPDEHRAVVLYAVAARDFMDFLDMVKEPETSPAAIRILKEMCSLVRPESDTDHELNKIILSFLQRAFPEKYRQMDFE